jgi:hypothetical protein
LTARLLLGSAVAYVAVTLVIGREVLGSLTTMIANDAGDPLLTAAILAWNATHIPWTDAWFQFPIFFPTRDALVFSEHLLAVSLFASPVYWATGNAVTAYNITLLLSYPLCGLAMYALVWRLTKSAPAAFLAGLAYAFAPYRVSHLPHIQVLMSFWAPLALLGLHRFVESGRWRWLALFAMSWMLQGASNGYFLVYFTVLIGLWVLWFLAASRRWRDAGLIAIAAAVALLPLAPILYRYLVTQRALGLSRNLGEIASFGADIAAPLCAPASLTFWGWLRVACAPEGELFAGAALVVLCVAGIVADRNGPPCEPGGAGEAREVDRSGGGRVRAVVRRLAIAVAAAYFAIAISVFLIGPWRLESGWLRASVSAADKPMSIAVLLLIVAFLLSPAWRRMLERRSTATFYLLAAIACMVLAWGPFPRLFGTAALYQAPYAWLLQLPGVGGLRAPARFWMIALLCLIVFMGLVVARLLSRSNRRAALAIVVLATAGLLADGFTTIPVAAVPPTRADVAALRGTAVLVLPAGDLQRDLSVVYQAATGGWRAVNGYSGYEPAHYEALRTLSQAADPALFEPLRDRGDLNVVVDESDDSMRRLVEAQPGVQMVATEGGQRQYLMPRQEGARLPAPGGERIDITALTASCGSEGLSLAIDADLDTRWVCGPQVADGELRIDLGRSRTVGAVVHALGSLGADFPRELRIETSSDGAAWEPAWRGSPAANVLSAAIEAPRSTRLMFLFSSRSARYVRLRQIGRHERNYWSIAELEVWTGT